MNIITLDFETYFANDYTLRKLTTEEYIRDPRFEVHGAGLRFANGERRWLPASEIAAAIPPDAAVLSHHAHFDMAILAWHFGVRPALILDTLSMARMVLGNHVSASLDSVAKHFGLAGKTVPYDLFKNRHWHELSLQVQHQLAEGCLHDVDLTWQIFNLLARDFPAEEYGVVDMTVRMFTEPRFVGDVELLGQIWMDEAAKKRRLMAELGVTPDDLQSAARFVELLRAQGVEPETKQGKAGPIPAIAKTDDFMKTLLEHDNERVAMLAAARLGVRSTITQSRAERLGWTATRGAMPVYLSYCAAHTTRWGGGDKVNWQNFPNLSKSPLRRAIMAPPGFKLAVVDASNIECRILNHVAGQLDVVEAFAAKRDIYSENAGRFYGRPISRADKVERHLGKVLELGCGYGMGWRKFQSTCRVGALGGPPIILDDNEAGQAVGIYRETHPAIAGKGAGYWAQADMCLKRMANFISYDWGVLRVECDAERGRRRIVAPNGAYLIYDTLEWHVEDDTGESYWRIRTREGWVKTYGGKLTENIIQFLARIVVSQAMLRMRRQGFVPATSTHDEVVVPIRAGHSEHDDYMIIENEMRRTPDWLPGIPLDAEGGVSERYEK